MSDKEIILIKDIPLKRDKEGNIIFHRSLQENINFLNKIHLVNVVCKPPEKLKGGTVVREVDGEKINYRIPGITVPAKTTPKWLYKKSKTEVNAQTFFRVLLEKQIQEAQLAGLDYIVRSGFYNAVIEDSNNNNITTEFNKGE